MEVKIIGRDDAHVLFIISASWSAHVVHHRLLQLETASTRTEPFFAQLDLVLEIVT